MALPKKTLPLVKSGWPWKAAFQMRKDPVGFLKEKQKLVGNIYRIDAPIPFVVLSHHEHLRHVLQVNWRNYKKGPAYEGFALMLGNGLLNSEGEEWKKHRKLIQPGFNRDHIQGLTEVMFKVVQDFSARWTSAEHGGQAIELKSAMIDLSLEVIARVMLGESVANAYKHRLLPLLQKQYAFVMLRNRTFFRSPLWVPTRSHRNYHKTKKELHALVYEIIELKRAEADGTLLSMIMQSHYEDGTSMSREDLRDEFLTLFVTGFETTGNALTWTFLFLAKLPEVQERLWNEIKPVAEKGQPSVAVLMQCAYLNNVIKESLRLYPPVWIIARRSVKEDTIDGFHIPKNAHIFMSNFMSQRDPALWDSPEEFKPDRFAVAKENPAYLPFGAGARMCIGNHFSHIEMLTALFTICARFRIELAVERGYEIDPKITLQPKGDVMARLIPRN